jgi:hypothetical protein
MTKDLTVEEWLAIREEEGLKIDPSTAEWGWCYARMGDPYDVYPELSDEFDYIGREYFARRLGSPIWVAFLDLPEETRSALSHRPVVKLPFPPGRARTRLAELVQGPAERRARSARHSTHFPRWRTRGSC